MRRFWTRERPPPRLTLHVRLAPRGGSTRPSADTSVPCLQWLTKARSLCPPKASHDPSEGEPFCIAALEAEAMQGMKRASVKPSPRRSLDPEEAFAAATSLNVPVENWPEFCLTVLIGGLDAAQVPASLTPRCNA